MPITVTGLFVYPVKSLAGIPLSEAQVTDRGFRYDRRWMLVDEQGMFLSQRELASMALLVPERSPEGLLVRDASGDHIMIQEKDEGETLRVGIWEDECEAILYEAAVNQWFSKRLNISARLVYMPESSHRNVDPRYAHHSELVGFADGYPFLMISEESLADLNHRLDHPVAMNRFRPNLVTRGGEPYLEDTIGTFRIGDIEFRAAKPCARCQVVTIDQQTAAITKEPLRTLSSYRRDGNKVLFGMNLLHQGSGSLSIGDRVFVEKS